MRRASGPGAPFFSMAVARRGAEAQPLAERRYAAVDRQRDQSTNRKLKDGYRAPSTFGTQNWCWLRCHARDISSSDQVVLPGQYSPGTDSLGLTALGAAGDLLV
eukprot:s2783_g4.t1